MATSSVCSTKRLPQYGEARVNHYWLRQPWHWWPELRSAEDFDEGSYRQQPSRVRIATAIRTLRRASALCRFDGNLSGRFLGFGALRQRHGEHTLLEACLDLVAIDVIGDLERALKRTEAAFAPIIVLLLLFLLVLLLAPDE